MISITKKEHDHAQREAAKGFEEHPEMDIVDVPVLRNLKGDYEERSTTITRWKLDGEGSPYLLDDVRVLH